MLGAESVDHEAGCSLHSDAEVLQLPTIPGCATCRSGVEQRYAQQASSESEQENVGGVYMGGMMMIEELDNLDLSMRPLVVNIAVARVLPNARPSRICGDLEFVGARVVQMMDTDRGVIDIEEVAVEGCRRCEVGDLVGVASLHVGPSEPEIIGVRAAGQYIVSAQAENFVPIATAVDDIVAAKDEVVKRKSREHCGYAAKAAVIDRLIKVVCGCRQIRQAHVIDPGDVKHVKVIGIRDRHSGHGAGDWRAGRSLREGPGQMERQLGIGTDSEVDMPGVGEAVTTCRRVDSVKSCVGLRYEDGKGISRKSFAVQYKCRHVLVTLPRPLPTKPSQEPYTCHRVADLSE